VDWLLCSLTGRSRWRHSAVANMGHSRAGAVCIYDENLLPESEGTRFTLAIVAQGIRLVTSAVTCAVCCGPCKLHNTCLILHELLIVAVNEPQS
jgi:hypothetical protein